MSIYPNNKTYAGFISRAALCLGLFGIASLTHAEDGRATKAPASVKSILEPRSSIESNKSVESDWRKWLDSNRDRLLSEYFDLLRIPSISADPAHAVDVGRAGEWLVKKLSSIGMKDVKLISGYETPVVYAEWNGSPGKPTALIYGHYDVQPAQADQWTHGAPFEPAVIGDRIYARGAADDKGGILIPIMALEYLLTTKGDLPINIKFLLEGAEESGSKGLNQLLLDNKELFKADFGYNADGMTFSDKQGMLWMGFRGASLLTVTLTGANKNAHSGLWGGAIPNANAALSKILASLHTPTGRVAVKDFYSSVEPLTKSERREFSQTPFNREMALNDFGLKRFVGDPTCTERERMSICPTLEITGMAGGHFSDGYSSIVPYKSIAKLHTRLVYNQNPRKINELIKGHIKKQTPPDFKVDFSEEVFAEVYRPKSAGRGFDAAYKAFTSFYGQKPVVDYVGGTIPVLKEIYEVLGIDVYSFGFQRPDSNIHSSDEFMRVSDFEKGPFAYILLLDELAKK